MAEGAGKTPAPDWPMTLAIQATPAIEEHVGT
jgi:hypothetical protein